MKSRPLSFIAGIVDRPAGLIALLGIALVAVGAGLGLRDPWPSDEPRFALIARDMVASGDWLFPRRGGELYPDKPPLFIWLQALVYWATGSIRVAFMLPNVIASLLTLTLVYDLARRIWGYREAFLGGAILLITPMFLAQASSGQIDMLVTFWVALGMYGFLRYSLLEQGSAWAYLGFLSCGLGVITKGVGFLPILVFAVIGVVGSRLSEPVQRLGRRRLAIGLLVTLATIGCWLIPMLIAVAGSDDPAMREYRDNILLQQTVQRYAQPSHHFQPWWYFFVEVIPALWLPLLALSPWLVAGWIREFKAGRAAVIIPLLWAATVILFFTLSPAKRGVYILPALPWVAFAAGPVIARQLGNSAIRTLDAVVTGVVALLLLVIAWQLITPAGLVADQAVELRGDIAIWAAIMGVFVTSSIVVAVLLRRPTAYAGAIIAIWIGAGTWVFPMINGQRSGRALMEAVAERVPQNAPLALVNWKEQLLLQSPRPVANFGFRVPTDTQVARALVWLQANSDGQVLLQDSDLEPCFDASDADFVAEAHRRRWYLVGSDDVSGGCSPEVTLPQ